MGNQDDVGRDMSGSPAWCELVDGRASLHEWLVVRFGRSASLRWDQFVCGGQLPWW